MAVPFIDLKRWEPGFLDLWQKKIAELSVQAQFIGGEEVEKLENSLTKDSQCSFAVTCANGTDALQLALRAGKVGPGDIVLVPDFTFWAAFEAIVNVGASPVTVDISPNDLQMDYDLFCLACEKYRPKAAVLVHLFGWGSANLQDFRGYSQKNGIFLVEDGAQSYGTLYQGKSIYQGAQIATTSFYPAKVFGGAGDGGAVFTSDSSLAKRVRSLGNHGRQNHYSYELAGWNSRLDALQAAYLNLVHERLPERIESRRAVCGAYRDILSRQKNVLCLSPPEDFQENGYLNALLLKEKKREEYAAVLKEKKIGYAVTYPQTISEQNGAKAYLRKKTSCKTAKKISLSILNLPLFPYMRKEEINEVSAALSGLRTSSTA